MFLVHACQLILAEAISLAESYVVMEGYVLYIYMIWGCYNCYAEANFS